MTCKAYGGHGGMVHLAAKKMRLIRQAPAGV
jgi:hypothetical protein